MSGIKFNKNGMAARVRTHCVLQCACFAAGIECNGSQIWDYFCKPFLSVAAIASGKFNKLLNMVSLPSQDTIKELERRSPGTERLFNAPLWAALQLIENHTVDITPALILLDMEIMAVVYEPKRDSSGQLVRRQLLPKDIKTITSFGSLSALSCLMLLRYEGNSALCWCSKNMLDRYINETFINVCVAGDIPAYRDPVYRCLRTLLYPDQDAFWDGLDQEELKARIRRKELLVHQIMNLLVDETPELPRVLAALISIGRERLIRNELLKVQGDGDFVLDIVKGKALMWLLSKLKNEHIGNSHRLKNIKSDLRPYQEDQIE